MRRGRASPRTISDLFVTLKMFFVLEVQVSNLKEKTPMLFVHVLIYLQIAKALIFFIFLRTNGAANQCQTHCYN